MLKKISCLLVLITSISFAEEKIVDKLNEYQKKDLKSKNYENFNIQTIEYYSKIDDSDVYLKLLQNKLVYLEDKDKR